MRILTPAMAQSVIGKPYLKHGRGPDGFDCWGVVCTLANVPDHWQEGMESYRDVIAEFVKGERENEVTKVWKPVPLPEAVDGDVVGLGKNWYYAHAGVWFRKQVIHATEGLGVVMMSTSKLRTLGWNRIGIYRWQPND